ncbi:receptor-like protein EIX2 [Nicotiana sylvestris]|uniref:Probable leucine-rich repeat receptor-like protein kinase At5g63930 n=1 Tax=Nicotiana sylvestris TaxID=4096 RepID=A0A1U7V8U5_NICSY|nr:PREDICTED: probable leucine-rich repeat receptor-like protein kinase At5g63930 [Nicotiana sylvestris]
MKVLAITFCFFLFFILTNTKLSVCIGICRENEQQTLESLKKEVYDPANFLSSWIVGKDCCEWEGVVCHNLTRHVIELHIGNGLYVHLSRYDLRIYNFDWLPSLSNLENLEMEDVDLSNVTNWLQVINMLPSLVDLRLYKCSLHHIPPLLHHNFSSLETLDLSGNNFSSSIPKWVFNLPNLVSLNLAYSNLIGAIPREAGNVTKLRNLYLAYNKLNSTIPNWIYRCKDLDSLFLNANNIKGLVSNAISNLSSITSIDLSENMLSGKLPNVIGKLSKLSSLSLSKNLFEGEVFELFNSRSNFLPAGLRNSFSLTQLGLGNNKLTGTLPESLGQLSMLEWFDISNNRLEGVVTENHFTNLTKLEYFKASDNNLTLGVSQNWIPSFQALDIEISGWNIGPHFPMWLQTQKYIQRVDISNGGIQGEVPTWFWNLSSQVQFLDLSHNQFVGEVPIISIPSWLMLSGNKFTGPLPQISPNVNALDLSNNSFSGGLSHFLCETNDNVSYILEFLNLEGNDLSGEIPDCWINWPELIVLNLRDNNLIGGIPKSMEVLSNLKSLDFRRNRLTGPLPSSLSDCTKLLKIDLAENEFVGQLPPWLGMKFSDLIILSLSSNRFYGELPPEICYLKDLQILDLANNSFFGTIPRCIGNLIAMIAGSKWREADIDYNYNYSRVPVRESAMVTTKGNIYQYDKTLALVTSMDMSINNLSGDIPISFTSLVELRICNFSKNHLTGRIPNGIGDMKVLESLDLSENQLSGQIPQSISSLSTLSFLNLSYNSLSGKIPVGSQLQSFNSSSFQGNELCGLPLLVNCSLGGQIRHVDTEKDERDEDELDWFYIAMSIGFGLNFWGVCSCLLFKRSWRHAYYRFLDSCWESLCVKIQVWEWI